MVIIDAKNILILIIGLLNIALGFMVYLKNRHNPSNFWFFMMCLFGGGWGVVKAFQLSVVNLYLHDLFIARILMFFGIVAPLAYFMLAYNFPYIVKILSKKLIIYLFAVTIILEIITLSGVFKYVTASIVNNSLHRDVILFNLVIFAIYFFVYVIFGAYILLKKYYSSDGIHKIQIKYLLWATLGTFITTGFVSVVLLLFNIFTYDWLGAVFLLIHFGVAGYLIFIKPKAIR